VTSISTLLAEHLSLVDVVCQPGPGNEGAERLHLFNTGESFVGAVDLLPPPWVAELKGETKVARGSARAPMREFQSRFVAGAGELIM
jgi:hypothetical protein